MNNPETVKVGDPGRNSRELKVVVENRKSGIREEKRTDSPASNGLPQD